MPVIAVSAIIDGIRYVTHIMVQAIQDHGKNAYYANSYGKQSFMYTIANDVYIVDDNEAMKIQRNDPCP